MTLRNDMEKGRIEFENESDRALPREAWEPILCGCGKESVYQVGWTEDNQPVFACNKFFRCPTYNESQKLLIDRGLKIAKLEQALEIAREAIPKAIETIRGLSEQQAMDDNWYENPLAEIEDALSKIDAVMKEVE